MNLSASGSVPSSAQTSRSRRQRQRAALSRFGDQPPGAGPRTVADANRFEDQAAERIARHLGDLLGLLAATTRDTVKMRLRIETGRARTRSSVELVASVTDPNLFADPDPVPAVKELMGAGALASTPTTQLVQDPTDIPDPA